MSIILEVDNSDVDIGLASVRGADDSFMVLNDHVDETSPQDDSESALEELQSASSDSSYLNIDMDDDDDIDNEEIDATESVDLNGQQPDSDLEEVRYYCRGAGDHQVICL